MNQTEIAKVREIFESFDTEGTGYLDLWRLKDILLAFGNEPTDEELFVMISEADVNGDGALSLGEVLRIIQHQRIRGNGSDDDSETLNAWIALGGANDKSGKVTLASLKAVIAKFGFRINLDAILKGLIEKRLSATLTMQQRKITIPDELDYDEFKNLLQEQAASLILPM